MGFNPRIRLFVNDKLVTNTDVTLNREQSHYLATVMRKSVGDRVALFNGIDGEWWAIITGVAKKSVSLSVKDCLRPQKEEPDLWLAFAPLKSSRTDFIVEKATELGVSYIMPVKTHRTNAGRINKERFEKIALEAAEQCERLSLPRVAALSPLQEILKNWPKERALVFCDETLEAKTAIDALKPLSIDTPMGLLVGPEGGFTKQERALILAHPFCVPVHLGPRILRADTAVLSGLSLILAVVGDWQKT